MESLNVVINDELCLEIHSKNTPPVLEKTMEVYDSIPNDYVGKHSDEEAEYIGAGSCCSQLLWMKKLLSDYEISQDTMVVYCDNSSAIDISKNPVQHSITKHIEIRYHFIRDLVERKIVVLEYILTELQNADIFTKSLDRNKFETFYQVIDVILCP